MARVINFNNIPVLITGDHPVIDLILKELSPFPSANKSAEIKFNITLSEIHPERGSLNLGSGIYATKDSLYIDLRISIITIKFPKIKIRGDGILI